MASRRGRKEQKEPDTLPAVIIADSFTEDLRPVTLECPRTLVPVAGVPLLDYALEALIANGVEEIFVFCCAHSARVERHLQEGRWARSREVTVRAVVSRSCDCIAQALRDIHDRDIIRRDFILVTGDVIFNRSDLRAVWQRHVRRRSVDPQLLMTVIAKEEKETLERARADVLDPAAVPVCVAPVAQTTVDLDEVPPVKPRATRYAGSGFEYLSEERFTAVYDPVSGDMLQYVAWKNPRAGAGLGGDGAYDGQLRVDLTLFAEHPTLKIRSDLVETGMAVCSQDLLRLFVENFDFRDMRDCIRCVINEELLGNKIALHTLPGRSYVKRIRTWGSYLAVCRGVAERWTHPLTADAPFASVYHDLQSSDLSNLTDSTAVLRASCRIGPHVIIGPGCEVGLDTVISHTCLGRESRVGNGCEIRHSQIWENVVIEEGSVVQGAVICSGAVVGAGCVLEPGSVVSFGVRLSPGTKVAALDRLTCLDQDGEGTHADHAVVGDGGVGRSWEPPDRAIAAAIAGIRTPPLRAHADPLPDSVALLDVRMLSVPYDDGSSDDGLFHDSDSDTEAAGLRDDRAVFPGLVRHLLERAVAEDKGKDGVLLELKALKYAANVSMSECSEAMLLGILQTAMQEEKPGKVLSAVKRVFDQGWGDLFGAFVGEQLALERELITVLTEFAKEHQVVLKKIGFYLLILYNNGVISKQSIMQWDTEMRKKMRKGKLPDADCALVKACADAVEKVETESEEEEEEEEEEETETEEGSAGDA
eukprot:TRINITY_DN11013_c0_g1_i1.p1 TRINITY_DN11013_c0_g1~~TRINITY_DN11013_c0_g1_i1.p1  ORF type:complete len:760 (+),score=281.56 TRINITY_DN11013_c0_g1_i1:115-2394(+)